MKTGTFEVMEQNEMMAVSGGGLGSVAGILGATYGAVYYTGYRLSTGYTRTVNKQGKRSTVTYTPSSGSVRVGNTMKKIAGTGLKTTAETVAGMYLGKYA